MTMAKGQIRNITVTYTDIVTGKPLQPNQMFASKASGLYYKLITIVNDNSRVINKLETSIIEDA
jgi:hypothetical protein